MAAWWESLQADAVPRDKDQQVGRGGGEPDDTSDAGGAARAGEASRAPHARKDKMVARLHTPAQPEASSATRARESSASRAPHRWTLARSIRYRKCTPTHHHHDALAITSTSHHRHSIWTCHRDHLSHHQQALPHSAAARHCLHRMRSRPSQNCGGLPL